MSSSDLPVISTPSDSTKIDLPAPQAAKPAELRRSPPSEIRKPAVPVAPADPRKASEVRKPGSVAPVAPRPAMIAPAAPPPRPAAPAPAAAAGEDEDPEKLLREYAERQKTKVLRLEQQLGEQKRVLAERDAFKAKADALARELQEARRQLEASAKQEEMIKDLQAKVDASLLASTMATDENGKLKAKVHETAEALKKAEGRASQAEKALAEAQKALAAQSEGRKDAETRIAAALQSLQGSSPSVPIDAAVTRPVPVTRPAEAPRPAVPARPVAGPLRK
jgi:hypothetical protein